MKFPLAWHALTALTIGAIMGRLASPSPTAPLATDNSPPATSTKPTRDRADLDHSIAALLSEPDGEDRNKGLLKLAGELATRDVSRALEMLYALHDKDFEMLREFISKLPPGHYAGVLALLRRHRELSKGKFKGIFDTDTVTSEIVTYLGKEDARRAWADLFEGDLSINPMLVLSLAKSGFADKEDPITTLDWIASRKESPARTIGMVAMLDNAIRR
jgi:hypothetical protein